MKCLECKVDNEFLVTVIHTKSGCYPYCANHILIKVCNDDFPFEIIGNEICEVTGKPGAIKYVDCSVEYKLCKDVFYRLIRRNLKPEEFHVLMNNHGSQAYLLHDDFYVKETGEALQPV